MFSGRIIGVDPGITATGYGVISCGGSIEVVSMGEIRPHAGLSFARRLEVIFEGLEGVIGETGPAAAAVEGLFHAKNTASAFKLAHARGVVFLAAARRGIPIFEYSPLEVKAAVTGYGAAEKVQVEAMIRALLCIRGKASGHACDALAVAVCHFHTDKGRAIRGAV